MKLINLFKLIGASAIAFSFALVVAARRVML
jgi:hypothetical protein